MPSGVEQVLRRLIRAEGPVSVARYMEICLGHPEHGYYMTRDPFGRQGDFVTAPEVNQMFGELIGVWTVQTWADLGAPERFTLMELGPGRGTLMKDVLRTLKVVPECRAAARVRLVETSPVLRQAQRAALGDTATWHDQTAAALAAGEEGPVIVLANEFFDALPIHQLVRTATGWRERRIGIDGVNGGFRFMLDPSPTLLENLVPPHLRAAAAESLFEVSPASLAIIGDLARSLTRRNGAALIIDYGHGQSALGETLQAVRDHAYAPVLADPGQADLTAHVDFAMIAEAARSAGLAVDGPVTQADFLTGLGIGIRAERLQAAAPDQADAIAAARTRLTAPDQMGHLFKVLSLRHPDLPPRPGFPS